MFHCERTCNYSTRSASKNILDIPYSQTYTYGTKSVVHSCIKDWNNFKRSFPKLFQGQLTYPRIKSALKNHLLKPILNLKRSSHSLSLYIISPDTRSVCNRISQNKY